MNFLNIEINEGKLSTQNATFILKDIVYVNTESDKLFSMIKSAIIFYMIVFSTINLIRERPEKAFVTISIIWICMLVSKENVYILYGTDEADDEFKFEIASFYSFMGYGGRARKLANFISNNIPN